MQILRILPCPHIIHATFHENMSKTEEEKYKICKILKTVIISTVYVIIQNPLSNFAAPGHSYQVSTKPDLT